MLSDGNQADLAQMTRAILRKLGGYFDVTDEIGAIFDEVCTELVDFDASTVIVAQGGRYGDVFLVDSGWVMRARHLESGARQIVNLALPGDFVAMNALLFATSDFELRCKTDVRAFRFSSARLGTALARDPRLGTALIWANAYEESMLAERIVSLGRRSARARTAHVLCEIVSRLEIIGVDEVEKMIVPISQEEFADILGISVVHVNKTLRGLERDGVLSFRNAVLTIMDRRKLEFEAGFEKGYLHFTRRDDRNAWRPAV